MKASIAGLGLMLCVTFGAAARAGDFTTADTRMFPIDELTWRSHGKAYRFLWGAVYVDGRIAICGVGRFLNPETRSQTQRALKKGRVLLDGKPILTGIDFFTDVGAQGDIEREAATCRDTGVAKPKGDFFLDLDVEGRAHF